MSDKEFRLPDLGEGLADAELVSWTVGVGDEVALNQTIAEVETAKALVELPSPYTGRVTALLAEPGDTVAVGAPLIRVAAAGSDPANSSGEPAAPAQSTPAAPSPGAGDGEPRQSVLVGYGPETAAPAQPRTPQPQPKPSAADVVTSAADQTVCGKVAAKPMARKLARELGVDLTALAGPHPVTADDVRAAAQPARRETREPAGPVRKRIAAAMTASARTIPQVSVFHTADAAGTLEVVAQLRNTAQFAESRLTPLAVIARLALLGLRAHPLLNARWDTESGEIVQPHFVSLGVAVATRHGLLVPVVKDADQLTLPALCAALNTGAQAARNGTASPAALTGATFTISNFGTFGVDAGTPMVPPGTGAILGVGAIREQPLVCAGEVVARPAVTLSLAFDHRLIDGDTAAAFLTELAMAVTNPAMAVRY